MSWENPWAMTCVVLLTISADFALEHPLAACTWTPTCYQRLFDFGQFNQVPDIICIKQLSSSLHSSTCPCLDWLVLLLQLLAPSATICNVCQLTVVISSFVIVTTLALLFHQQLVFHHWSNQFLHSVSPLAHLAPSQIHGSNRWTQHLNCRRLLDPLDHIAGISLSQFHSPGKCTSLFLSQVSVTLSWLHEHMQHIQMFESGQLLISCLTTVQMESFLWQSLLDFDFVSIQLLTMLLPKTCVVVLHQLTLIVLIQLVYGSSFWLHHSVTFELNRYVLTTIVHTKDFQLPTYWFFHQKVPLQKLLKNYVFCLST